ILESPLNLCITCDRSRGGEHVLGLPEHVYPLAYLCLGYVDEFLDSPELARAGWRQRLPLAERVHGNGWQTPPADEALVAAIDALPPHS
ncbi:MAG: 5,6-dimethylbenzimidazole synthase, partial [Onishia taeanensis]